MGGTYSTYGEIRNMYKILVIKSEGKDHLGDLCIDGSVLLFMSLNFFSGRPLKLFLFLVLRRIIRKQLVWIHLTHYRV
jgi:hypothetical protein